jgi:hypothetical protein
VPIAKSAAPKALRTIDRHPVAVQMR